MKHLIAILIASIFLISPAVADVPVDDAQQIANGAQKTEETLAPPPILLREGFVLKGVEGLTSFDKETNRWFFAADTDLDDTKKIIEAGTKLEMLETGKLEQIEDYAKKSGGTATIRLWAKVTRYAGRNYLFAVYFITMTGDSENAAEEPKEESADNAEGTAVENEEEQSEEKVSDSGSVIPSHIMQKLKPKRVVSLSKMRDIIKTENNAMLVDRTGFLTIIVEKSRDKDAPPKTTNIFTIDGLGRNIDNMSFQLLPCEALQTIEKHLATAMSRQRYRIAGEVTKYKNNYYIMLQRAAKTYSHGNFAR
jgi:hypothetical protein